MSESCCKTPTPQRIWTIDGEIIANKELRRDIDGQIQKLKTLPTTRERSLAITKLQEGVMWIGMDLKRISDSQPCETANADPYPHSKDPSTTVIDPTADNLKL